MLRIFSTSAIIAIAAALQVSAGALHAQSYESLRAKTTARQVMPAPTPHEWTDRYASMLSVGADPGSVPPSTLDARIAKLQAVRMSLDSVRARRASVVASRRIECPMPVITADSSRFDAMKVAPRDSGPSSPWAVEGRLIGCTNPMAK